ncbi:MAG: class I SAM-dependent methyltransferase [Actinomycetia bacterium]|nr:class I SAM-dependent methyltransferase [Actinomycetes bacterium]
MSAPAELNVGVDLNISALPTTAHSPKGWAFICADALALPFRDHSCTDLRVQAVLHHLVPTAHALSELTRVLRPDGLLTIVDGVALSSNQAAHLDLPNPVRELAPFEPDQGDSVGLILQL